MPLREGVPIDPMAAEIAVPLPRRRGDGSSDALAATVLFVRVLGLPIASPQAAVNRVVADVGSVARIAREAHAQFDRMLELGEEIAEIGGSVREIAERLDGRVGAFLELGERLDARAGEILEVGERLDHRGEEILNVGERLDHRGQEILDVGEHLDHRGQEILDVGDRLGHRGEAIVDRGEQLAQRGTELVDVGLRMQALGDRLDARSAELGDQTAAVTEAATELIALLPTLERALQMATPLEGAIDRFGRLVDRLPGGRRADTGAPHSPSQLPEGRTPRPQ